MLDPGADTAVYLYTEVTDMRRGFDRLAQMVEERLGCDPLQGGLYVFFGRRRDRAKILMWDRDGYVLWYKRLEAGTFKVKFSDGYEEITGVDLKLLLQGMDLERIKLRKKVSAGVFTKDRA